MREHVFCNQLVDKADFLPSAYSTLYINVSKIGLSLVFPIERPLVLCTHLVMRVN